jgi:hypothetical protein
VFNTIIRVCDLAPHLQLPLHIRDFKLESFAVLNPLGSNWIPMPAKVDLDDPIPPWPTCRRGRVEFGANYVSWKAKALCQIAVLNLFQRWNGDFELDRHSTSVKSDATLPTSIKTILPHLCPNFTLRIYYKDFNGVAV